MIYIILEKGQAGLFYYEMQYGESDMERPHNSYGESLNLLFYMGSVCCKYCQRHNGPKTLSTLTHSTPLVQSAQKLQQALKSWSNFCLVLFGKGQVMHVTNPCKIKKLLLVVRKT